MEIKKYTLENSQGMKVDVLNYGGIISSIMVHDKNGTLADVVLGFDSPEEYLTKVHPYFGAVIGRYANRIDHGTFTLNQETYYLFCNDGAHSLHGGKTGFDKVFWTVEDKDQSLILSYFSPSGEEGFPGDVKVRLTYSLSENNELSIEFTAQTNLATPLNLTHHSYFNLTGIQGETIHNHYLMINADQYLVVNDTLIPTGEIRSVEGMMDFRQPQVVGERLRQVDRGGFDHNYVLNQERIAASLYEPKSGRFLEVLTTQPGLQFYSGHFLDGKLAGKGQVNYPPFGGLCLEAQHFPDSPHHQNFPSTVLWPSEVYRQKTVYRFSVKE